MNALILYAAAAYVVGFPIAWYLTARWYVRQKVKEFIPGRAKRPTAEERGNAAQLGLLVATFWPIAIPLIWIIDILVFVVTVLGRVAERVADRLFTP